MHPILNTPANRELYDYLRANRLDIKFPSEPIALSPGERDILRRFRLELDDDRWALRRIDGGGLLIGTNVKTSRGGRFDPFYCGRPGVFGAPLIRKAQLSSPKYIQRVVSEMEREEAKREMDDEARFEDGIREAADNMYNYWAMDRKHFVQTGAN